MRYQKTTHGYMVRLEKGEEISATLTRFMASEGLAGGSIVGIGAVDDVVIGSFDVATKGYHETALDGVWELINLTGNFAMVEGEVFLHAHVVVSGHDMKAVSGHLFRATIAVTGEFHITTTGVKFERKFDEAIGLKLLDLSERF